MTHTVLVTIPILKVYETVTLLHNVTSFFLNRQLTVLSEPHVLSICFIFSQTVLKKLLITETFFVSLRLTVKVN